ncbi:LuxR C-terminal-related transcriptional regulator [Flavobacterium sp.]|uniref:LuxR C-terminal-related transcriptional regulator n=1 Tax=Flavobacterium sp. TaxID=239 RepID=UPI0025C600E2|nr:LuxR C-terminal-related transcriptional regulator [Flavobacterium sp.]MBA4153614.1 hypothetical protein [Flavobacterium sp.]
MQKEQQDYALFFKFIEAYSPEGFSTIKESDSLILDLEEQMALNNQFFYFADLLKLKIIFTSKKSFDIIGVHPNDFDPQTIINKTHPDELPRLLKARTKLFKISGDLLAGKKSHSLFSTNIKTQNSQGEYSNILHQLYFFYCELNKSVYLINILNNIDWYTKNKNGFQYYHGDNLSCFKYPDEDLLSKGNNFSTREFEIIKLIEKGLSTKEIAEKLFISPYTVNTHRRNIIAKTDKPKIADIISDLFEMGFL